MKVEPVSKRQLARSSNGHKDPRDPNMSPASASVPVTMFTLGSQFATTHAINREEVHADTVCVGQWGELYNVVSDADTKYRKKERKDMSTDYMVHKIKT